MSEINGLTWIRLAATKRIIYSQHAVDEMLIEDLPVSPDEVRHTVLHGELVEEYPEDRRGYSYLLMGKGSGRIIHVVCAPKDEYLAIITVYVPSLERWEPGFRTRRTR